MAFANSLNALNFLKRQSYLLVGKRDFRRWLAPTLRELKKRRDKIGPEPPSHRSTFSNWNYNAELSAFGKRLHEEFQADTLRKALTHKSYVDEEEQKREELGISENILDLKDNSELIVRGEELMDKYIKAYLRFTHQFLPEEGICAIYQFLVGTDVLSHVSSNIGTTDLILCKELFPSKATLANTLKAVVGALEIDRGTKKAQVFVQDFIITQLVGRDINDMWQIVNPMGVLVDVLGREGRELPESRLLRQSGATTIQAVYNVGIYSARKLIGLGPGETVIIAEEMAARDALKHLFQTKDAKAPLPFGTNGHNLKFSDDRLNPSIVKWTTKLAMNH